MLQVSKRDVLSCLCSVIPYTYMSGRIDPESNTKRDKYLVFKRGQLDVRAGYSLHRMAPLL